MESFAKIRSPIIVATDAMAVVPVVPKPLKNTLKTQIAEVITTSGAGSVYSRRHLHRISRSYDGLSQLYLKVVFTAPVTDLSFSVKEGFGAKIFDQIILRTEDNVILQTITPEYTLMRIDELNGSSSIYDRINNNITPAESFSTVDIISGFTSGTATVYCPLFFFFSEAETNFMETRMLQQLVLELRVAPTNASMGVVELDVLDLAPPLFTSIDVTLFSNYHDVNTSSIIPSQRYSNKPGLPRALVSTYNTFYEENVPLIEGQTSVRLLLRNNQPLFNLHAFITSNSDTTRIIIKTMTLTVKGHPILTDMPREINYTTYSLDRGFAEAEAYSYWFSKDENRIFDTGLLTFGEEDSMFPVFMTITFDALEASDTFPGETWTLYTFSEYRTYHEVNEKGLISDSNYPGKMQMMNSDLT